MMLPPPFFSLGRRPPLPGFRSPPPIGVGRDSFEDCHVVNTMSGIGNVGSSVIAPSRLRRAKPFGEATRAVSSMVIQEGQAIRGPHFSLAVHLEGSSPYVPLGGAGGRWLG